MKARFALACSAAVIAGSILIATSRQVVAQNAETPTRSVKLSGSGSSAIWGDDQNVFVLVGNQLYKVRKYDMRVEKSVALKMTTGVGVAAQKIKKTPVKKTNPDEE